MDPLSLVAGFLVGVIVNWIAMPLGLMLGGLVQMAFADVPHIGKRWSTSYEEPGEDPSEIVPATEILKLRQIGRFVWGTGVVNDDTEERKFAYRGKIVRGTLIATYRYKGKRGPTGTGAVQLRIEDDDNSMAGWCVWHDRDSKKIEASRYHAVKAE